ncbi:MAG: tRNA (guanosine(37)-N1)-methyltransferase TrmD [Pseudomonadota bacterium]
MVTPAPVPPWVGVLSVLPEVFTGLTAAGVVARALREGLLHLEVVNPRDFALDKHRTVDDRPYGGGPGMVLMFEPLERALAHLQSLAPQPARVVMLSPDGLRLEQNEVSSSLAGQPLILVCGRYEGIDQRFIDTYVDALWSVGDFVVSGGELPAMLVIDALARFIPGTLGNLASNIDESHLDGTLDYPHYTRPEMVVPAAGAQQLLTPAPLRSGNHAEVAAFRRREALGKTYRERPDMLTGRSFNSDDRALLQAWLAQQPPEASS